MTDLFELASAVVNPRNVGGMDESGKIVRGSLSDDEILQTLKTQLSDPERNPDSEPELRREISKIEKRRGVSVADAGSAAAGGTVYLDTPQRRGVDLFDLARQEPATDLFSLGKFDQQQAQSSPVTDTAKSAGAGVLQGTGATLRGAGDAFREGGDLVAKGANAALGTELRSVNPLAGAADWLEAKGKALADSRSPASKKAEQDSNPRGDLLAAIKTGDFSKVDLGEHPSFLGYTQLAANVFGQMVPIILGTAFTKSPGIAGGVLGGAQGGGAADEQAAQNITSMSDEDLAKVPLYKELIEKGADPASAKQQTADAAARMAFLLTTPVSAVGGAITGKIMHGGMTAVLPKAVAKNAAARVAGSIGGSVAEEGIQETAEGVTQNLGQNLATGTDMPLGEGSMQNAVLGAMGGVGPGAIGGISHGSQQQESQPQPVPARVLTTAQGAQITTPEEFDRWLAPMAHNERADAVADALAREAGIPLDQYKQTPDYQDVVQAFTTTPISEQGKVIGQRLFPEPPKAAQEAAQATQTEEPTVPASPAPVPAKTILRAAKQRLDAIHKKEIEAQPQLERIGDDGKPVFTPGHRNFLTDSEKAEREFLGANMENPAALAKHLGVELAPEAPSKVAAEEKKLEAGDKVVESAVRVAKGKSNLGDTIERNQATAAKEIDTARAAQKVDNPEPKVAKAETQVDKRPQPAAAVKSMEGDLSAIVGKRAPAASSKVASTVAEASKTLKREEDMTAAHKQAVEKSKAIEAERAKKKEANAKPDDQKKSPAPAAEKEVAKPKKRAVAKNDDKGSNAPVAKKVEAPKPKLGPKGQQAVAKSQAKVEMSPVEQKLYKHALGILKKIGPTDRPISELRDEMGHEVIDHPTAKLLVEKMKERNELPHSQTRKMNKAEKMSLASDVKEALAAEKDGDVDLARRIRPEPTAEHRVSIGLGAGPGSPMEKTLAGREIPRRIAHRLISETAERVGVKVLNRQDGTGAYLTGTEGAIQVDARASEDQIRQFISSLGYQLQQREVIAVRESVDGGQHAYDIFAPTFSDQSKVREFWDHFLSLQTDQFGKDNLLVWGYQDANVDGKSAVRFLNFGGRWSPEEVQSIDRITERAAHEAGIEIAADGVHVFPVNFVTSLNEWSEAGGAEGQSHLRALSDAGGDQEAGYVAGRYSPQSHAEEVANGQTDLARAPASSPSTGSVVSNDAARNELARAVGKYFGGEAKARQVLDVVAPNTPQGRLAQIVGSKFGYAVHFFSNHAADQFNFDGAAPDGSKNIFINESNARPLMQILGHELLHKLRQTDEPAYQALVAALRTYYNETGRESHAAELEKSLVPGEHLSNTKFEEEFVADLVGEAFLDPAFYERLAKDQPTLFQKIADKILEVLKALLGYTTAGHSEYVTDVVKARQIVADALALWIGQQAAPRGTMVTVFRGAAKGLSKGSFARERLGGASGRAPSGLGVFFTTSADYAAKYGHVEEFRVRMRKPFEIRVDDQPVWETVDEAHEYREKLRKQGYDGIIIKADHLGGNNVVVAFAPEQVQHADGGDLARHTPAGIESFDDSKVRDENGELLTVYHGTSKDVNFKSFRIGQRGSWFSTDPKEASMYAATNDSQGYDYKGGKYVAKNTAARLIPAYLNIKNPYVPTAQDRERLLTATNYAAAQRDIFNMARMQGHDGINLGGGTWVAFKPQQVKSIFSQSIEPTTDFARLNQKQRMAAGQQVDDLYDKSGVQFANDPNKMRKFRMPWLQKGIDMINKWGASRMSPLGLLPDEGKYLVQRGVAMGFIAQANELSSEINDIFKRATDQEKERVYHYWTTFGSPSSAIGNAEMEKSARDVKTLIEQIGEKLVHRGLLDPHDFEQNRGKYLPRLYLKHLLKEDDWRAIGTGKSPSDLGYTKRRKDIAEDIRLAILGEIRDPAYLGAMAVGKPLRDIALMDFLDVISKNKDWVWHPSMTTHKGLNVSVKWVDNEIKRIKEQIPYYKDQKIIQRAQAEIADLEQTLTAATVAQSGQKSPDDFVEIPDLPRYGLLRGMLVRKEIHDDLVGSAHMAPDGAGWAEHFLGYGGVSTKAVAMWKTAKVALNPPGQIRNFLSNLMLLHLSGVPMHLVPVRLAQAIKSIRTKDKYHDIAMKYGMTIGTFGTQEMYRIEQEFLKDEGAGGPFAFMRYAKLLASKAGDAYQLMETMGKIAKVIDEMERRGVDETTAVVEANKWLFDYSLVPNSVRYLRNAPVGAPFLTFYYKLAPRLLEVAANYPWRFAPYVAMSYILPQLVAGATGVTPDDLEKMKKALPEWLREKMHVYALPWKDENGRWQFLDLSYLIPWTMFTDAAKQAAQGKVSEVLKTTGLITGPIPDMITAIRSNKDAFTGQDIANAGDPAALQMGSWMTWLYNMAMPPVLTNRGLIGPDLGNPAYNFGGKLHQALVGSTNRQGEPRATEAQALLNAVGISMYPVNPEVSRSAEIQRMQMSMMDAQRLMISKLRDRGLSDEAREKIVSTYRAELIRRQKELQQYAQDSELPASVK